MASVIEEYLDTLSPAARKTQQQAELALRSLVRVTRDMQIASLGPKHINGWVQYKSQTCTNQTINIYVGEIRKWVRWVHAMRYASPAWNPLTAWKPLKREKAPADPLRIPKEEWPLVLDGAPYARDRYTLALGLYTGLRGIDVKNLRIGDIDVVNGWITSEIRKTRNRDELPMVTELAHETARWLHTYRAAFGALDPDWYLVPARKRLSPAARAIHEPNSTDLVPTQVNNYPWGCVQRALEPLGYPVKGTGAHTLRRSCGLELYKELRDRQGLHHIAAGRIVQAMLGHKEFSTTERYIGQFGDRGERNELLRLKPMFLGGHGSGTAAPAAVGGASVVSLDDWIDRHR